MFPTDYPLFQFLYTVINTPGFGGIAAAFLGGASVTAYLLTLRWIARGADADEVQTYAYPTPALHQHEQHR